MAGYSCGPSGSTASGLGRAVVSRASLRATASRRPESSSVSAMIVPDRPPSMLVIVIDRFSDIPAVVTSLAAKRVLPRACRLRETSHAGALDIARIFWASAGLDPGSTSSQEVLNTLILRNRAGAHP